MKETKQYLHDQVARAQLPRRQEADCVDTAEFGTPIFETVKTVPQDYYNRPLDRRTEETLTSIGIATINYVIRKITSQESIANQEIILFTFRIGTAKAEHSLEVDGLSIGQYAKAA